MQFGCWVLLFSLFFILLGNYSINLFGWYFLWLLSITRSYAAKCIWRTDNVDCLNSKRESWLGLIFKRSIVNWNKCEYLFLCSPPHSRSFPHSDRFRAFDDKSHHCRLHKANKVNRDVYVCAVVFGGGGKHTDSESSYKATTLNKHLCAM